MSKEENMKGLCLFLSRRVLVGTLLALYPVQQPDNAWDHDNFKFDNDFSTLMNMYIYLSLDGTKMYRIKPCKSYFIYNSNNSKYKFLYQPEQPDNKTYKNKKMRVII